MHKRPRSPVVAVALDAVSLVIFVLAGRQSHGIDDGAGRFIAVLWPIVSAWFATALLLRLYTGTSLPALRLGATVAFGVGIGLIVRILVTHRDTPVAFVLVAYAFITLTTVGWRMVSAAVPRLVARRRG